MKGLGKILLILGIIGLVFSSQMDTSVKVNYPNGTSYGLPDRVNNIGLINEKQNYLIISGIVILAGLMMFFIGKSSVDAKIVSDNTFYCQKCGEAVELLSEEIEEKKYFCPKCKFENILS